MEKILLRILWKLTINFASSFNYYLYWSPRRPPQCRPGCRWRTCPGSPGRRRGPPGCPPASCAPAAPAASWWCPASPSSRRSPWCPSGRWCPSASSPPPAYSFSLRSWTQSQVIFEFKLDILQDLSMHWTWPMKYHSSPELTTKVCDEYFTITRGPKYIK